jgi:hypothetical protein
MPAIASKIDMIVDFWRFPFLSMAALAQEARS